MSTLFYTLFKMSLQGIVIILIVGLVRLILKKLRISHTYIVGLWLIVFFYLVFPWKLSLPIGFWENGQSKPNEFLENNVSFVVDNRETNLKQDVIRQEDASKQNIINDREKSEVTASDIMNEAKSDAAASNIMNEAESDASTRDITDKKQETIDLSAQTFTIWSILPMIWLTGLIGFVGYFIYSYIVIREKISMSIPYKGNIMWIEDMNTPMVFGLIRPKIYLPVAVEQENLPYIIAHEKMHIKRKDSLFKLAAYLISVIHWYNPFIWMAYFLLCSDIEKACDEEVINRIGGERKKEYAYTLLRIASGDTSKKRRIFVAPICFDEGNVKDRIINITKYRYTLPAIGGVVLVLGIVLAGLFLTQTKSEDIKPDSENDAAIFVEKGDIVKQNDEDENMELDIEYPTFYIEEENTLQIGDVFSLEDYYITSRYTASNHFYIDENQTLWGMGMNEYGQLGTGTYGVEEYYEQPVKIAENVVSVDASWNDYFCIYLTESGELYGMGLNYAGLLLGKGSEEIRFSHNEYQKVTTPVLLMNDVAYARAGRECVVALQRNKTAYWWGQYAPLTHTYANGGLDDYWKMEEDEANPVKLFASEPVQIMENCKYITTGTFTGAAISENDELYTWGFNAFGQCGVEVTEDDFIRTPVKVMDDVKMVWVDKIEFSASETAPSDFPRRDMDYLYHTFILTKDNSLLAAGLDLGNKEKITEVSGDILETQLHLYTDFFVPVRAVEYSEAFNRECLNQLKFGMQMDEVEGILRESGLVFFRSVEEEMTSLCVEDSRYYCYFNEKNEFNRLLIQEGGSRDNRFALGISQAELEELVKSAGGVLTKESDTIYSFSDNENQIKYEFLIYEGSISVLWEEAVDYALKLTVEEAWGCLKKNYTFFETAEMEEISYDDYGNMQIVIGKAYWPWSDEEFDRFCESLVFYNTEEDSCYLFGHHYVYYEEDEETVFATQTKGWYAVNYYTGEVSRW